MMMDTFKYCFPGDYYSNGHVVAKTLSLNKTATIFCFCKHASFTRIFTPNCWLAFQVSLVAIVCTPSLVSLSTPYWSAKPPRSSCYWLCRQDVKRRAVTLAYYHIPFAHPKLCTQFTTSELLKSNKQDMGGLLPLLNYQQITGVYLTPGEDSSNITRMVI